MPRGVPEVRRQGRGLSTGRRDPHSRRRDGAISGTLKPVVLQKPASLVTKEILWFVVCCVGADPVRRRLHGLSAHREKDRIRPCGGLARARMRLIHGPTRQPQQLGLNAEVFSSVQFVES